MTHKKKKRARELAASGFSYQAAINQLNAKLHKITSEPRGEPLLGLGDISDEWRAAFATLEKAEGANAALLLGSGAWHQSFECLGGSTRGLPTLLPGAYEQIVREEEDLLDGNGDAIDVELATEVWVCESERALLSCVDHWQAGLCGGLTVFPTLELLQKATAEAMERDG